MSDTNTTYYNGIGICPLLTVLFVGLKMTGHITWSWVWVLSPLWIPIVVIPLIVIICITCVWIWHQFT